MGDRLEEDARDRRVLDSEADDLPDLVLVDAALDGGGERDAHPGLGAASSARSFSARSGPAADRELGLASKPSNWR